jgi:Protein of unknown function (DUF3732)
MSVQIMEIVLYSHDGRSRALKLRPDETSVITGASKTGKSALISIVDYCFASSKCHVPEGPIRRNVSWFGLRLRLVTGEAFVARRCPDGTAASSEDCHVEVGVSVAAPSASALRQTTNTKGLEALLTEWIGIRDNLFEPPPGQTRPPLTASVRHALTLCFQPQDEIIRKVQLFHGTDDRFVAQALKDTLPYFLGAVEDDYVRKREELRRLRDRLRSLERQLAEMRALRGDGVSKADGLLAQARDAGLTSAQAQTWEATIGALRKVGSILLASVDSSLPGGEEFARLSSERARLLDEQRQLRDEIARARDFVHEESGFSREATEQQARLKSIGIFDNAVPGTNCPLCEQSLEPVKSTPSVVELSAALTDLSSRLSSVGNSAPRIEKVVTELESRIAAKQQELARNRATMEAVRAADERVASASDDATRRSHILGRISLYLESLPDLPDASGLEQDAEKLRAQCAELEEQLSDEHVKERLDSIKSILGEKMTTWARELKLEHSESPLRLDFKRLTVVADTADGPVPMAMMGSGENWVGYHLITHLVLHQWFAQRNRPVPRFLFLDQPSQVYFPAEKEVDGSLEGLADNDRAAVSRMIKLIFTAVKEVWPGFQVIVTEHADIYEDWYQSAVVERWRGGLKLVPEDWPRK